MTSHRLAGKPAPADILINVPRLITAYFSERPEPSEPSQRVAFGTSGHRGSALSASFNEAHILAITQAVCNYRRSAGISGPLFLGMDTHALSEPAFATALEVLAANDVQVCIDAARGYTPTPAISHAILAHNRGRDSGLADGIVITPSHNPPEDGGIKYNPPHGGPSESDISGAIEKEANLLLAEGLKGVARISFASALRAATTGTHDFVGAYVADLENVIDVQAIRQAHVRIGVDPMGGAAVAYWRPIAERYGLDITVVNDAVDPAFRFMSLDWDGKIRMDCSSPHAMSGLIALRDRFDIAFGNDTDADRHGIVTPSAGLLNPNHYLAVAIEYLFSHRERWPVAAAVGKTLVSSSLIDRVTAGLGRRLHEVPVGFKWFVDGLQNGALGFAGEESAGATFLRHDGGVWTTDKDGVILGLLAAEIKARTGRDPGERYADLTRRYGVPFYARVDAAATPEQKARLAKLSPDQVRGTEFAGEKIEAKLTRAPGDGNAVGGLKVVTKNGWFAARPSGTENIYKLYAESFLGAEHLKRIQSEAQELIRDVLSAQ